MGVEDSFGEKKQVAVQLFSSAHFSMLKLKSWHTTTWVSGGEFTCVRNLCSDRWLPCLWRHFQSIM